MSEEHIVDISSYLVSKDRTHPTFINDNKILDFQSYRTKRDTRTGSHTFHNSLRILEMLKSLFARNSNEDIKDSDTSLKVIPLESTDDPRTLKGTHFDREAELAHRFKGILQRLEQGQSMDDAITQSGLAQRGNVWGHIHEFMFRATVIPGHYSISLDNSDILGLGGISVADVYDDRQREGVYKQVWLREVKNIIRAPIGRIFAFASPSGWTGIFDDKGTPLPFDESQLILIKRVCNGLEAYTIVNDMDLDEHESFLKRLHRFVDVLGGQTERERVLNIMRTVGYTDNSDFEDIISHIKAVKKSEWIRWRPEIDLKTGKRIRKEEWKVYFDEVLEKLKRREKADDVDIHCNDLMNQFEENSHQKIVTIVKMFMSQHIQSSQIDKQLIETLLKSSSQFSVLAQDLGELVLTIFKGINDGWSTVLNRRLTLEEMEFGANELRKRPGCDLPSASNIIGQMDAVSRQVYESTPDYLKKYFCIRCGSCKARIDCVVLPGDACPVCRSIRRCGAGYDSFGFLRAS